MEPQQQNINTYSVNGKLLAIPQEKNEAFLKDVPNALPVYAYEVNGKKLGIPKDKIQDFLKDVPGAKALYNYPDLMPDAPKQQPLPEISQEEANSLQNKFNRNPRAVMGMDLDSAQQVVNKAAAELPGEEVTPYEGDRNQVIADIDKKLNYLNQDIEKRTQNEGVLQKTFAGDVDDTEYLARNLYNKSLNQAKAVSGTGGTGVGDALKDRNFWTLGAADLTTAFKLKGIANKIDNNEKLRNSELMLLDAWHTNEVVNQAFPIQDAKQGYQVGKSVTDMIPWLVQFAATRGAETAGREALTNTLIRGSEKYLGKTLGKAVAKGAGEVAGAYGAAALMPNTYSDMINRSLGQTQQGPNGNISFNKDTADSPLTAIYKGWTNSALDVLTERLGEGIEATKVYQKLPKARIAERMFGEAGKRAAEGFGKFTKAVGWNGAPLEYFEEWVNVPANALLVGDSKFSDMFDGEQQLTTFLTVVAMGSAMGTARAVTLPAGALIQDNNLEKELTSAEKLYKDLVPPEVRNSVDDIRYNGQLTVEEQGKQLYDLLNGLDNNEAQGAILNYLVAQDKYFSKFGKQKLSNNIPQPQQEQQPTYKAGDQVEFDVEGQNNFTVNPADTRRAELENFVSSSLHQDGSLTVVEDIEGNQWFVSSGSINDADKTVIVYDPEAPNGKRGIPVKKLKGDPMVVTPDEFIENEMARFNQEQEIQQEIDAQSVEINGQRYLNLGEMGGKIGLQPLDENGQPMDVDAEMWSKQDYEAAVAQQQEQAPQPEAPAENPEAVTPAPEAPQPTVVNTVTIGKNNYKYTTGEDGSFSIQLDENQDPAKAEKEIRATLPKDQQNRIQLIQQQVEVPSTVPWVPATTKTVTTGITVLPEAPAAPVQETAQNDIEVPVVQTSDREVVNQPEAQEQPSVAPVAQVPTNETNEQPQPSEVVGELVPDEIKQFKDVTDEQMGVEFEEMEEDENVSSFTGLEYSGVECTGYACRIKQIFGDRAKIFGFNQKDNPTQYEYMSDGHDFAVVDDRYIIDPWFKLVEGDRSEDNGADRVVSDLNDQAQSEFIKKYYGDPAKWERMEEIEEDALKNKDKFTALSVPTKNEQGETSREEIGDKGSLAASTVVNSNNTTNEKPEEQQPGAVEQVEPQGENVPEEPGQTQSEGLGEEVEPVTPTEQAIAQAEAETETNPTEEQKESGEYNKGQVTVNGFDIAIETVKGEDRTGKDEDGNEWSVTMNNSYGYYEQTNGTEGNGEEVDVFLGPNPESERFFIVDQVNTDGSFDEHKVMQGFDSKEEAAAAYLSNYSEGWQGLGAISELNKDEFAKWLKQTNPNTKAKRKPVSEMVTVKKVDSEQLQVAEEQATGLEQEIEAAGYTVGTIGKLSAIKASDNNVLSTGATLEEAWQKAQDVIANNNKEQAETAEAPKDKKIGVSRWGDEVWEDTNGNRYILYEGGIASHAPVEIIPGRATVIKSPATLFTEGKDRYLSKAEYEAFQKERVESSAFLEDLVQESAPKEPKISKRLQAKIDQIKNDEFPEDHPLMILDRESKQFEQALDEYLEGKAKGERQKEKGSSQTAGERRSAAKAINPVLYTLAENAATYEDFRTAVSKSKSKSVKDISSKDLKEWYEIVNPETKGQKKTKEGPKTPAYGTSNKVFTADAAANARAILKAKLGQMNTGLDPELMMAGIQLAGYHVEAGARKFADYSKAMVNDIGAAIEPYLKSFYNSIRTWPGFDNANMDSSEYVDNYDIEGAKQDPLQWAKDKRDELVEKYLNENGKHLDPDEVRKLFMPVGYHLTNVEEFRDAEKYLVKEIYPELLKRYPDEVVSIVLGIPGAGKSHIVNEHKFNGDIVFDSVMGSKGKAENNIDMALASGHKVRVTFVHSSPQQAFEGTVNRGVHTDRFVPIPYMLKTSKTYSQLPDILREKYGDTILFRTFVREGNTYTRIEEGQQHTVNYDVSYDDLNNVYQNHEQFNNLNDEQKARIEGTAAGQNQVDTGGNSGIGQTDEPSSTTSQQKSEGGQTPNSEIKTNSNESEQTTENIPVDQVNMDEGEPAGSSAGTVPGGNIEETPDSQSGGSQGTGNTTGTTATTGRSSRGNGTATDSTERSTERNGADERGTVSGDRGSDNVAPEDLNHVIEADDVIVPTGEVTKIRSNIKAIRLAKKLEKENRNATPEEKKVLAQYVGWGGLAPVFKHSYWDNNWQKRYGKFYEQLTNLLSPDELQTAKESTINAHYTERTVIEAMWNMVDKMGFKGGRVLEPGAGVGHFFGLMPEKYRNNTHLRGVELDKVSGLILSKLYPQAQIGVHGFEEANERSNSYDLVITNVPFAGIHVHDSQHKDISKEFTLHNYFIAKSVRLLKPGAVGVFITTSSTMDNEGQGNKFRKWVNDANGGNADLIDAIRLPNNAFKGNAGTEVTTDILFIRKRDGDTIHPQAQKWLVNGDYGEAKTKKVEAGWSNGRYNEESGGEKKIIRVNEFYLNNPDRMLGEMKLAHEVGAGGLYSPDMPTLHAPKGLDVTEKLNEIAAELGKQNEIFGELPEAERPVLYAQEGQSEGELVTKDGKPYLVQYGELTDPGWNDNNVTGKDKKKYTKAEVVDKYNAVKRAVIDLVVAESNQEESNESIEAKRKELNKAYNHYAKTIGTINENNRTLFLRGDVDYSLVSSLENVEQVAVTNKKGEVTDYENKITKADIFNHRVNTPQAEPTTADNILDAVDLSFAYRNGLDVSYMASLLNSDKEAVEAELLEKELAFRNPATGIVEDGDTYLSGNVRKKLIRAQEAAANDESYQRNVDELTKVIPPDVPLLQINAQLGATWVPTDVITGWINDLLGGDRARVYHNPATDEWSVEVGWNNERSIKNTNEHAAGGFTADKLIKAALNQRKPIAYDSHSDGSRTKNEANTLAAQEKINELKSLFQEYVWSLKDDIAERSIRAYNDVHNAWVNREVTIPETLTYFPGASTYRELRHHQKVAVKKALAGSTLLAHQVGTGKTYTLITIAMEMKRLGIAKKPMIVVQRATTPQFVASFRKMYPNAKLLVPDKKDLEASERKRLFAKIGLNDWDAVIIYHDFLTRIPDKPDRQIAYIEERIAELQAVSADEEAPAFGKSDNEKEIEKLRGEIEGIQEKDQQYREQMNQGTVKDQAKRSKAQRSRLQRQFDRATDQVLYFEDMGIDALLVDEAHTFKRLGLATKGGQVKGIDTSGSQKSVSAKLKTRYILENNNGKNVVFATGTPISNTMAEAYTMLNYLIPDRLVEHGIKTFDDFRTVFGSIEPSIEFTAAGSFKIVERFAKYINLPELQTLWQSAADVVLTEEIEQLKAGKGTPVLKDGKHTRIELPMTEALEAKMDEFKEELRHWEQLTGREKRQMRHVPLVVFGLAKRAAIDVRLVDPNAADDPNSKTNKAVENIFRLYEESKDYKGTQLVFSDMIQSSDGVFNLYDEIKRKLVEKGVKADEIAIISDYNTDAKRGKLFEKVNSGEVRVVIGSTEKLGVGVNVQKLLKAVHHLDAPGRPMDFEQRNGRILRQGNLHLQKNLPVEVVLYGVEKTLDATAYQRLAIKDKFIKQMMSKGISAAREIADEDADMQGNTFDQMMANLSGSQYAVLHVKKSHELRNAEMAKRNYEQRQQNAYNDKIHNQARIEAAKSGIKWNQDHINFFNDKFPEHEITSIKIGDVMIEGDIKGINEGIAEYVANLGDKDNIKPVIINGNMPGIINFKVSGELTERGLVTYLGMKLALNTGIGKNGFTQEYKRHYKTARGMLNSFIEEVEALPKNVNEYENFISRKEKDNKELDKLINTRYPDGDKLQALRNEVAEIETKMQEETNGVVSELDKKVKTNVETSVNEVANMPGMELSEEQAQWLYENREKLNEVTPEQIDLTAMGFINADYLLTQKGKRFVRLVNNRIFTRTNAATGMDLFPETTNIPELTGEPVNYAGVRFSPGSRFFGDTLESFRHHRNIAELVQRYAEDLDIEIEVVRNDEQLPQGIQEVIKQRGHERQIGGVFNPESGAMYLITDNIVNLEQAERVILHEAVGHMGLRKLLGENFTPVLEQVWNSLSEQQQRALKDRHDVDYWEDAADEYLAEQAELDVQPKWWQNVLAKVREVLRKVFPNLTLKDYEIHKLLKRSKDNLTPDPEGKGKSEKAKVENEKEPIFLDDFITQVRASRTDYGGYKTDIFDDEISAMRDFRKKLETKYPELNFTFSEAQTTNSAYLKVHDDDFKTLLEFRFSDHAENFAHARLSRVDKWNLGYDVDTNKSVINDAIEKKLKSIEKMNNAVEEVSKLKVGTEIIIDGKVQKVTSSNKDFVKTEEVEPTTVSLNGTSDQAWLHRNGYFGEYMRARKAQLRGEKLPEGIELINEGKNQFDFKYTFNQKNSFRSEKVAKDLGFIKKEEPTSASLKNTSTEAERKSNKPVDKNLSEKLESNSVSSTNFTSYHNVSGSNVNNNSEQNKINGNPDIRFKKTDEDSDVFFDDVLPKAAKAYEERKPERDLKQTVQYIREFWQDINLPIRKLEEEIKARGGVIWNRMKPYRDMNLSFGRTEELYRQYTEQHMEPILEAIRDLVKSGKEKSFILPYIISKHAIERNREMRMEEYDGWIEANEEATPEERAQKLEDLGKKDYSGVRDFNPSKNYDNPDQLAEEIVEEFELNADKELLNNLWQKVNAATGQILDHWKAGGAISEKQYNKYKAQYQHFVPLRGWRQGAAKHLRYNKGEGFGASLRHAEGRKSLADNPLAYMQAVAFKSIGERVTNEVNQSLLNLVMKNYDRTRFGDLYAIKEVYYVKGEQFNPESGEMEEVWDITLIKPDKEQFDAGNVKTKHYKEHMKLRSSFESFQHEVIVHREGGDVAIVFDQDMLTTAQAFNRQNTIYELRGKLYDAADLRRIARVTGGFGITNFMKGMFTSMNPVFPFTNAFRDIPEAAFSLWIQDGNGKVPKNLGPAFKTVARKLWGNPEKGSKESKELDKQLQQFYETGAATGFTHEKSPEEIEKELEKDLIRILQSDSLKGKTVNKAMDVFRIIQKWNQLFEDTTRFAVFLSSLEAGKSKEDAAMDAKEASVNFNRKGKGTKLLDSIWAFFNPAIQAAQKNFKLAKDQPKRFAKVAGAVTLAGFMEAMLNDLGDGDDDEYYNLNDYVRQNYSVIGFGEKYLRIPLPQFWRGFHSLGVIGYDLFRKQLTGQESKTSVGAAGANTLLNFLGGLSPIDIPGFWVEGEFSLSPMVPTWAKPVYEVAVTNRDFMQNTIAKEPFTKALEDQLASSSLHKKNVNPAAKAITDFLSKDVGGKYGDLKVDVRNGKIKKLNYFLDINPSKIEHLFKSYLGGSGRVFTDFVTTVSQFAMADEEVNINNIPFVNSFIRNTPDAKWQVIDKYYKLKEQSRAVDAVIGEARNRTDIEKIVETSETGINIASEIFDSYDEQITDLVKLYGMQSEKGTDEVIALMQEVVDLAEAINE